MSPAEGSTFGLVNEFHYGPGWQDRTNVAQPAAGAGFTYKIDGRYAERPVAVAFQLVTSAAVANRAPRISYQDANGNEYAFAMTPAVQAATLTWRYSFQYGAAPQSPANTLSATGELPALFMQPGDQLVLAIGLVDVGDQVSKIIVVSEKFGTAPYDYPPGQGPELSAAAAGRERVPSVTR